MKSKTAVVFGQLICEERDYIVLSQGPIKLADENGNPITPKDQTSFLVTVLTDVIVPHPIHQSPVLAHAAPFVVSTGKYAFVFETPHEIVCVDNSEEEEVEPVDLTMAWSAEDVLAQEG